MARARSRAGSSCIDPITDGRALRPAVDHARARTSSTTRSGRRPRRRPHRSRTAISSSPPRARRTSVASRCGRRPAASRFTTRPSARVPVTSIRCGRCRVRLAGVDRRGRATSLSRDLHQLPHPREPDGPALAQVPAASLELTDEVSDEDALQLRAYPATCCSTRPELELVMGAVVPRQIPGPPDANGTHTVSSTPTFPPSMSVGQCSRLQRFFNRYPTRADACRYALNRRIAPACRSGWILELSITTTRSRPLRRISALARRLRMFPLGARPSKADARGEGADQGREGGCERGRGKRKAAPGLRQRAVSRARDGSRARLSRVPRHRTRRLRGRPLSPHGLVQGARRAGSRRLGPRAATCAAPSSPMARPSSSISATAPASPRHDWELGIGGGDYGGANLISAYGAYSLTDNMKVELTLSQFLGNCLEWLQGRSSASRT